MQRNTVNTLALRQTEQLQLNERQSGQFHEACSGHIWIIQEMVWTCRHPRHGQHLCIRGVHRGLLKKAENKIYFKILKHMQAHKKENELLRVC